MVTIKELHISIPDTSLLSDDENIEQTSYVSLRWDHKDLNQSSQIERTPHKLFGQTSNVSLRWDHKDLNQSSQIGSTPQTPFGQTSNVSLQWDDEEFNQYSQIGRTRQTQDSSLLDLQPADPYKGGRDLQTIEFGIETEKTSGELWDNDGIFPVIKKFQKSSLQNERNMKFDITTEEFPHRFCLEEDETLYLNEYSKVTDISRLNIVLNRLIAGGVEFKNPLTDAIQDYEQKFFNDDLPYIIELARGIHKINQYNFATKLIIGEGACACILAASFLCIINENRSLERKEDHNKQGTVISFAELYKTEKSNRRYASQVGKIKTIIHCFAMMRKSEFKFDRIVEFRHKYAPERYTEKKGHLTLIDTKKVLKARLPMCQVNFIDTAPIDSAINMHHVDFANKFLGGGILSFGCVQEEIRFCVAPFCIVGHIMCAPILPNQAIEIKNARIFADSTLYGYGDGYKGPSAIGEGEIYEDINYNQDKSILIAMDAVNYAIPKNSEMKNKPPHINLILLKALAGFSYCINESIATGHWGCGAFKNDHTVQFMIQWMAATLSQVNVLQYHLFDTHTEEIKALKTALESQPVGEIYNLMTSEGKLNDKIAKFIKK
jgi:hypothetical protein